MYMTVPSVGCGAHQVTITLSFLFTVPPQVVALPQILVLVTV